MSIYDDASDALKRDDLDGVRALLEPLATQDDREAQASLGLALTFDRASFSEGLGWLRRAADSGHGRAAHNLAMALGIGGPGFPANRAEFLKYMEVSYRSGFEATVASDPLWWKR